MLAAAGIIIPEGLQVRDAVASARICVPFIDLTAQFGTVLARTGSAHCRPSLDAQANGAAIKGGTWFETGAEMLNGGTLNYFAVPWGIINNPLPLFLVVLIEVGLMGAVERYRQQGEGPPGYSPGVGKFESSIFSGLNNLYPGARTDACGSIRMHAQQGSACKRWPIIANVRLPAPCHAVGSPTPFCMCMWQRPAACILSWPRCLATETLAHRSLHMQAAPSTPWAWLTTPRSLRS